MRAEAGGPSAFGDEQGADAFLQFKPDGQIIGGAPAGKAVAFLADLLLDGFCFLDREVR